MAEEWWPGVLPAFGLDASSVVGAASNLVELRVGGLHGGLWRSFAPPEEQTTLLAWESYLHGEGCCGLRLRARDGAAWVRIDDRAVAILTVWEGEDLPHLDTPGTLAQAAGFLARFHRVGAMAPLAAPPPHGLGWAQSWHERSRRLKSFTVLAAERLHPTQFDLIYLDQIGYYQKQAERAAGELARACETLAAGVALTEVGRHRLYRGPTRLGFKSLLGLVAASSVRDLYRLMERNLPRLEWPRGAAAAILEAYCRELPLGSAALAALQAGLRFPNEHYRLAHHYYLNRKSWPLRNYLRKQDEIWRREPARQRLVEELPLLLP